jgi:hypothetical protein
MGWGQAGGPLKRGSITLVCLLTLTEITGGAPLLALFEKWPAGQPAPRVAHPNVVLFDVRVGFHRRVKLGIFPAEG